MLARKVIFCKFKFVSGQILANKIPKIYFLSTATVTQKKLEQVY